MRTLTTPRRVIAVAVLLLLMVTLAAGCGSSGTSPSAAYCGRLAEISDLDLLSDPAPTAVQHDLEQLLTLLRRAAADAPRAIRADARAAAQAQVHFNALYAAHGWRPDPTNVDPAFIALAEDAHLGQVYFRLERYQIRTCHDRGEPAPPTVAPA